ncbi:MAG: HEPN domain-containing protein [Nitrospiraceae bacterium]|nr:MAG: HEPN domain-containing protein [Nitrospiraceae bacterium]
MPHENKNGLGTPEEWLKRAKSNLAIARLPKTKDIFWEDYCFELQQAAEKALKAVLMSKGIKFRFVHDLAELLTLLDQNRISFPDELRTAAELTDYSVESRYPGPFEPVTEIEFKDALKIAEAVVKWAESEILPSV